MLNHIKNIDTFVQEKLLFSLQSGFTLHILGTLSVLGTRDSKRLRAEILKDIQLERLALPSELQLPYKLCAEERGARRRRGQLGGAKKDRRRKREREKTKQLWFAVTRPQASYAFFNTQAHVLSNLSRCTF